MAENNIAVIGSGISGLSTAWLLQQKHKVVLYESKSHLGGHTNTVDITIDGVTFPVDTGFIVFNDKTYPSLLQLFKNLKITRTKSDMSFSYSNPQQNIYWSGKNIKSLFAQPKNLVNLNFWRMLVDILRFNSFKQQLLTEKKNPGYTVEDFLREYGFSRSFRDWYLLPMAGAIWSCSPEEIKSYSLLSFIEFFDNHGLLQVTNHPQWYSVRGGAREYVKKMEPEISEIVKSTKVVKVKKCKSGIDVVDESGQSRNFSHVVLASHADQSLAVLDKPSPLEQSILGKIKFANNEAVLHTDESLLPEPKVLHSAWNFYATPGKNNMPKVSVSYLLNLLQELPTKRKIMLTLNPNKKIADKFVLDRFKYYHPVLDGEARKGQMELKKIQGVNNIWYCGAWTGNGFHESGLKSALKIAKQFNIFMP